MKKSILVLLLSLFVIACGDNKKVEKVEKVESDPVTVQLTVVNKTGKAMKTNATWGVDVKDYWHTIENGDTYVMKSNTHDGAGTVFTLYPLAPDNKAGTAACDPNNGTAQQTYGYWNGAAHNVANWAKNVSNPTPQNHFPGQSWQFGIDVQNAGNVMTEIVTITIAEACTEE
jgi:hypothetical protein